MKIRKNLRLESFARKLELFFSNTSCFVGNTPGFNDVTRRHILCPLIYLLYIFLYILTPLNIPNDKANLCWNTDSQPPTVSNSPYRTGKKWRITFNQENDMQVTTFSLRKAGCPPLDLFQFPLQLSSQVRYLGLNLDRWLTWNLHTPSNVPTWKDDSSLFKLLHNRL